MPAPHHLHPRPQPLAALPWLAVLTSTFALSAQAGGAKPPLDPVIDIPALLARDRLLEAQAGPAEERTLEAQGWVELDGQPPRELFLRVLEPIGEGGWDAPAYVYDVRDPARPVRIEPPMPMGGYLGLGYLEPVDLDHDGRQEMLFVGNTGSGSPGHVSLYRLEQGRLRDLIRGGDPGEGYTVFDHDGDGRQELVALNQASTGAPDTRPMRLLAPDAEGFYSEIDPLVPPGAWLPALFDQAVEEALRKAQAGLPDTFTLLVAVMRGELAAPRDLSAMQPRLERLYASLATAWDREVVIDAMGWPGNAEALPFLRKRLEKPEEAAPLGAAARLWLALAGEKERTWLMERLPGWIRRLPKEQAAAVAQASMAGLAKRGDPRGLEVVEAFVSDPSSPAATVAGLVREALLQDSGAAALLVSLAKKDPRQEVREAAAATLLKAVASWGPDPASWRSKLEASALEPLLRDPIPTLRADIALALGYLADRRALPALVKALEQETEAWPLRQMLYGLSTLPGPQPVAPYLAQLWRTLPEEHRRMLHLLVVRHGSPEEWLEGLRRVEGPEELSAYESLLEKPKVVPGAEGQSTVRPNAALEPLLDRLTAIARDEIDPRMRQTACRMLGRIDHGRAEQALRRALQVDPEGYVRSTAAEGLARPGHLEQEPGLLVAAYSEPDPYVRREVWRALSRLGTPGALEALIAQLAPADAPAGEIDDVVLEAIASYRGPDEARIEALLLSRFDPLLAGPEPDCGRLQGLATAMMLTEAEGAEARAAAFFEVPACREQRAGSIRWTFERLAQKKARSRLPFIERYRSDEMREVRIAVEEARRLMEA